MLSTLPELAQRTREGALVYHHGYEAETYKVRLAVKGTELQIPNSTKRIPPTPPPPAVVGGLEVGFKLQNAGGMRTCLAVHGWRYLLWAPENWRMLGEPQARPGQAFPGLPDVKTKQ